MAYLTLGNTDLRVSRVCMGGCPLGGYGWGRVREEELLAAIPAALDGGINFFDTADVYGLGQSERILGMALGSRRQEAVIATKGGVRVEGGRTFYDNSPGYLTAACEASLRRLRTDCIDLYQIHYRDGATSLEEVVETLENLRKQGKIRHFGLSNLSEADLPELKPLAHRFASVQNAYSLAQRERETLLLELRAAGLTPMTWGSLGQGILTGKYGAEVTFGTDDRRSRAVYRNFHGKTLTQNLALVERMRPIAKAHGISLAAVAVRFILDRLPGSVALCGAKRPEQILDCGKALGWQLTAEELEILSGDDRWESFGPQAL